MSSIRKAWRFLFGCAIGIGLGYTMTLLLSPGRPSRPNRPSRSSGADES